MGVKQNSFCLAGEIQGNTMLLDGIGVGRGGGEGGGGAGPPNNFGGGGQHTLWPPNNPPAFSFNFYVKQEKITNVPS